MVITYSIILFGLLFLIRPLQKNSFYILHSAMVVLAAYYIESHYLGYKAPVFGYKTLLFFVALHFIIINLVTFWAYFVDKRAAERGKWRVPEIQLHTLEFLGGWSGGLLGQKIFKHKTKKKSYQAMFWFVLVLQAVAVYIILKYLGFI